MATWPSPWPRWPECRPRSTPRSATSASLQTQVRLLDPSNVMARGWSITRASDGRAVRDAQGLSPGDRLVTTFASGSTTSTVQTVTPDTTEDSI